MQARLPVVNSPVCRERDEDVLIQNDWVIGFGHHVAAVDPDLPGTWTDELFPPDGFKSIDDPGLCDPRARRDETSVEATQNFVTVHDFNEHAELAPNATNEPRAAVT